MVKKFVIFTSVIFVFLFFAPLKALSAFDHVVINEVQIAGVEATHDFIELYNPTDTDYDLTDHRLVKRTASGSSDSSVKAFENGTTIPAHGYYLWSNSGWDPGVTPDASTAATIAANNAIALRNGPEDTGAIVDSVAWGEVDPGHVFIETSPYPDNPDANTSLQRNGDDTDNNNVDFAINNSPSPQNSSVSESPSPSPTESPTPTPTESPTPTTSPTSEPTTTPEPTVTPEPTFTPEPTVTPGPTATPRVVFLGAFPFGNGHKEKYCFLTYKKFRFGFAHVWFPKLKCVNL